MNWHFVGIESPQETALRDCDGSLSAGNGCGYGHCCGDFDGGGAGDGICYGDSCGDGFSAAGRDDHGDGYGWGDGDGDGEGG